MNAAPPEPSTKWTWGQWATAIAIVFAIHIVLIFIFGSHKPIKPATRAQRAPSLGLVNDAPGDWVGLNSASLFALPDNNGFSASMWQQLQPFDLTRRDWTEEPHWLSPTNPLPLSSMGAAFQSFVQTNRFARIHFNFNLPPQVAAPVTPTQPPLAQASTLQIDGAISRRRLLTPVKLPSWPLSDIAAPSIVQVLVDADGNVVSAVLLRQDIMSQGNPWEPELRRDKDADHWAVAWSQRLQFAPLPSAGGGLSSVAPHLTMGQLIFTWQTVPETSTNTTVAL